MIDKNNRNHKSSLIGNIGQLIMPHISPCYMCNSSDSSVKNNICADCYNTLLPTTSTIKLPHINQVIVNWLYLYPLNHLISRYKFSKKQQLSHMLAHLMLDNLALKYNQLTPKPQAIIAVPLHKTRERERGFNQSLLLAQKIKQKLQLPLLTNCCKRIKETQPQSLLSNKKARIDNMKNAFAVIQTLPTTVMLVDDVITTGTTISELAKTLKRAGVKKVYAFALAR